MNTPWLTLAEAAAFAKVCGATLRREAKAGRLRAYKVGGRRCWRFKADDISAWLERSATPTVCVKEAA